MEATGVVDDYTEEVVDNLEAAYAGTVGVECSDLEAVREGYLM